MGCMSILKPWQWRTMPILRDVSLSLTVSPNLDTTTDVVAMPMMDPKLHDGVYDRREGSKIQKKDGAIMLSGTDTLAGR